MQRVTRSTAVAVQPAAPASPGPPGFFTPGNPGGGIPATVPGYEWFNMVQEELVAVVTAAGLAPDAASQTQLRDALDARYLRRTNPTVTGNLTVGVGGTGSITAAGLMFGQDAGNDTGVQFGAEGLLNVIINGLARANFNTSGMFVDGSIVTAGSVELPAVAPPGVNSAARRGYVDGTSALQSAGFMRFPGGLIVQWLTALTPTAGGANLFAQTTQTWPLAFPTAVRWVGASLRDGGVDGLGWSGCSVWAEALSVSQVRVSGVAPYAPTRGFTIPVLAIGH
jgi:hypothetical protein